MKKYVCTVCGYIYDPAVGDPDNGVKPGTAFEDVPADWVCPVCGVEKTLSSPKSNTAYREVYNGCRSSFPHSIRRRGGLSFYLPAADIRNHADHPCA